MNGHGGSTNGLIARRTGRPDGLFQAGQKPFCADSSKTGKGHPFGQPFHKDPFNAYRTTVMRLVLVFLPVVRV